MPDDCSPERSERTASGDTRFDTAPATSFLKPLGVGALSILPIDWLP